MDSRVPLGLEAIGSTNMAPFLTKLFQIVSSPSTQQTICWTAKGDSFVISDPDTFAREILPTYFKHNNIRSFIRQLNTYGFRKRTNISSTDEHLEFFHEKFRRDEPALLTQIKRCHQSKAAAARAAGGGDMATAALGAGADLDTIRGRVGELKNRLGSLQTEIRDYNHQMEQKVNLLMHILQTSGGGGGGGAPGGAPAAPGLLPLPAPAAGAPPPRARRARSRRSRRCRRRRRRRRGARRRRWRGISSAAATRCSGRSRRAAGWRAASAAASAGSAGWRAGSAASAPASAPG